MNCLDTIRVDTLIMSTTACEALERRLDGQLRSRHPLLMNVGTNGGGSVPSIDYNSARDEHVSQSREPFNFAQLL